MKNAGLKITLFGYSDRNSLFFLYNLLTLVVT